MALWCIIHQSLNSCSTQDQILLAACRRFVMVRSLTIVPAVNKPFDSQPYYKNNLSSSSSSSSIIIINDISFPERLVSLEILSKFSLQLEQVYKNISEAIEDMMRLQVKSIWMSPIPKKITAYYNERLSSCNGNKKIGRIDL